MKCPHCGKELRRAPKKRAGAEEQVAGQISLI
jgi:hypothetical protein